MPPAPKSPSSTTPSSKRPGAPKAKGAVRAKSGCYTCRIRRKKCDEQPNDQGFCSTCVRLRLECLGFGAKRPDWLRENQNVVQLRDKIKSFLASQGMIKGHSGSGARSSEQPPILRLTLESDSTPYHSSPSSSPPSPPPRSLPNTEYPPRHAYHHSTAIGSLLLGYKNDVVMVEYLLCTEYIRDHIVNTIINNLPYISDPTSEQQAAALLSRVYFQRFARPGNELVLQIPDIRLQLLEVENALNRNGGEGGSAEDAMAALHLVSVVLFDGGCGAWRHYLDIAARYVRGKMRGRRGNMGGLEALRKLSEKEAFIVKTAIWFDVLASVTTGEEPKLMTIVRSLFEPGQSGIEEVDISSSSSSSPSPSSSSLANAMRISNSDEDKSSMLSPMGCQNKVVWALAEINALAAWKKEEKARGRLSIKELVSRSDKIERELIETKPHHPPIKILSDFNHDPIAYSRYLTSKIFQTSAMLYLHSVVSDGYPHVFQIKYAIEDVMKWIRRIPKKPSTELDRKIHKLVIRSTVFGFYITGALTDNGAYRKMIQEYLLDEAGEHGIWRERGEEGRRGEPRREVPWREKLLVNGEAPVLLV
ncbi:hypothetical protein AGABI1DRAFT_101348 [Agaricus bisporus var. burnettii JB137-S8]|uniref:Zn(2)-C6 fungal-type domain-containing protein n=1 Tax=Agaricus bisporus var. burnettii (strain JB137-S8 / ATCC MYA-4627 / FGSC 10392) TaxID=597362 RepID=K5X4L6_AGABU|nr:uncharacterized protein AGABI1DRAFT_101348 [Agaricus bisporus var. burnettii JB137-S8]EKM78083.1 hypothetical protein AGABI1DRAFT_101348 [Agaricus bisporus var. burnettii JB137-S8]